MPFVDVGDIVAGITLALTSVPQAVAYAELSGVSGWRGIATMGVPCLVHAFVSGSAWVSVGVTSITALMARQAVSGDDETELVNQMASLAIAVGIASLLLAASGAGALCRKVPSSVKAGFKFGFGLAVVSSQLNGAVAAPKPSSLPSFAYLKGAPNVLRLLLTVGRPWTWDGPTTALSILVALVATKAPKMNGIEVMVAVGSAALAAHAFDYQGAFAQAPPEGASLEFPQIEVFSPIRATLFAAVDFLQTVSVCGAFETEDGIEWSPNRELAAQGAACVASGLVGGGPCGASLSRSLLARVCGAKSPKAGFFHGLAAILLLPLLAGPVLPKVPKAALSSVVLVAVAPSVLYPKPIIQLSGPPKFVAIGTAVASILTDPATGFLCGLALAGSVHLLFSKQTDEDKKKE